MRPGKKGIFPLVAALIIAVLFFAVPVSLLAFGQSGDLIQPLNQWLEAFRNFLPVVVNQSNLPVATPAATPRSTTTPMTGACLQRNVSASKRIQVSGVFSQDLFSDVPAESVSNWGATGESWTSLSDGYVFDFTGAEWRTNVSFPFYLEPGRDSCLAGARVIGTRDPETPLRETWHSSSAFGGRIENFLVENIYAENFGDGIRFADAQNEESCEIINTTDNWTLRGAYFKDMYDDCIENDWGRSGLVDDSLFEGCYVGFSARPGNHCAEQLDSTNNVITIQNSLVWMKPMQINNQDGTTVFGNSELFKDESSGPQWSLHNNIFRADQSLLGDPENELGYGIRRAGGQPGDPNSKLFSCSNNIFVWLGPGDLPPPYNDDGWRVPLQWLKDPTTGEPCFTFTKDVKVWDEAVAEWKARHGY